MHACNLDVAIANLFALTAKSHLVKLPSLAEHIKSSLVVFLSQVYLADHLQDLAIRRVVVSEDLLVHLQRFFQQRERILKVSRLHVAATQQSKQMMSINRTDD